MLARARTGGTRAGLIVTASDVGFFPVPRLAAYAASKAFDLSLTEALAAELVGEPLDVLALCPTATRTRFAARSGFGDNFPGAQDPSDVARDLAHDRVAVWSGDSYATEVAAHLGIADTGGVVRAGVVAYVTDDDVSRLLASLDRICRSL